MFKIRGNYPYPILRESTEDYKNSSINVIYYYKTLKSGHKFKILCEINNKEILNLIQEKKACYVVQVESPNALYRKSFEFYDPNDIEIELKNDEVIDFVDIGVAVLAKEDIENFYSDDFDDIYKGISFKIFKNEVLGVFQNVRQIITAQNDILKELHSVFKFVKKDGINELTYDLYQDRIEIDIPTEIGQYYQERKERKEEIRILNSLICMPVMTGVIIDMQDGEEEFSSRLWFKTIRHKIEEIAKKEKKNVEEMYLDPFGTAQKILKNILIESIKDFRTLLQDE